MTRELELGWDAEGREVQQRSRNEIIQFKKIRDQVKKREREKREREREGENE